MLLETICLESNVQIAAASRKTVRKATPRYRIQTVLKEYCTQRILLPEDFALEINNNDFISN
jgi:hypothetical protein